VVLVVLVLVIATAPPPGARLVLVVLVLVAGTLAARPVVLVLVARRPLLARRLGDGLVVLVAGAFRPAGGRAVRLGARRLPRGRGLLLIVLDHLVVGGGFLPRRALVLVVRRGRGRAALGRGGRLGGAHGRDLEQLLAAGAAAPLAGGVVAGADFLP